MATVGAPVDIIALLRDKDGNPVQGKTVRMSASDSTPAQEAVTNASGEATFEVTSSVPATVTYYMTELEQAVDSESTVQVTYSGDHDEIGYTWLIYYAKQSPPSDNAPLPVQVYLQGVLIDTITNYEETVMYRTAADIPYSAELSGPGWGNLDTPDRIVTIGNGFNEDPEWTLKLSGGAAGAFAFLSEQLSILDYIAGEWVFFDYYTRQTGGITFDGSGDYELVR